MDTNDTIICYTTEHEPVSLSKSVLHFRPGVYGIAFTDDRGQVLLTRDKAHRDWALPGGGINLGESLRDAVAREIFEEVGLKVTVGEPIYFGEKFFAPDGPTSTTGWHSLRVFFLVHTQGTLDPDYAEGVDSGGANYGAAWVPVEELDALPISELDYDAIQRAMQWLELSEGPSLASADDDDGE